MISDGPNFPGDEGYRDLPPIPQPKHPASSFPLLHMTPHAMNLVNEVVDRSADFDRTLAEGGVVQCEVSQKASLLAYGDLTRAKGKLVSYIARLMDRVGDPALNIKRTEQVRYE